MSKAPRLTKAQSEDLNAREEVSSGPLTADELEAVAKAREFLRTESSSGSWKGHKAKGTSLYAEKRALLQDAADIFGLRWPTCVARAAWSRRPSPPRDRNGALTVR